MSAAVACLAAAACVAAGYRAARRLDEKAKEIEAWEEKLIRLENELRMGGAALPAMLRRGSAGEQDILSALADQMEKNPAADAEGLLLSLPWPVSLSPEERKALAECLRGLFSPEKEGQIRAVRRARGQWARFAQKCRESREKNAALYRKLGWLAGAAAFILLC